MYNTMRGQSRFRCDAYPCSRHIVAYACIKIMEAGHKTWLSSIFNLAQQYHHTKLMLTDCPAGHGLLLCGVPLKWLDAQQIPFPRASSITEHTETCNFQCPCPLLHDNATFFNLRTYHACRRCLPAMVFQRQEDLRIEQQCVSLHPSTHIAKAIILYDTPIAIAIVHSLRSTEIIPTTFAGHVRSQHRIFGHPWPTATRATIHGLR